MNALGDAVLRARVRRADTPAERARVLQGLHSWLCAVRHSYPWPALEQSIREDIATLGEAAIPADLATIPARLIAGHRRPGGTNSGPAAWGTFRPRQHDSGV